ncbi:inositol-phosphate phosphatase [Gracilibacillus halophilus YIM-C55.5]|uniref:Inositol-phosphate phosphatase n=1 Tax=Gracilibacillus halophilus YIM-C55.5 TaxID=1308866 RepID=N4WD74_9BACI|nr:inositol monophosphatase family protein [Gracilibacillus halophilus]ENH97224.1 inositol-phosphate phosphatase [Gracilibacillus halophilus YIM-C55.5]
MESSIQESIFEQAKRWVYQAGNLIKEQLHQDYKIETKSNANDLVTAVDKHIEQFFAEKIRTYYPDHLLLGEEGFGDHITHLNQTIWIIDPIDGTMNFVHQKRHFAISIGIYDHGVGEIGIIYNVMDDVLYTALRGKGAFKNEAKLSPLPRDVQLESSIIAMNSSLACQNRRVNEKKIQQLIKDSRGTRSYGSAALEFAFVAEGILDGYITMRLSPWDFAGGMVILHEVNGVTRQANGQPVQLLENNTIIACNPSLYQKLLDEYVELK